MFSIPYTDLHLHSEYSLQDGMIRLADADDPKHIKGEIILRAEETNSDTITVTVTGDITSADGANKDISLTKAITVKEKK